MYTRIQDVPSGLVVTIDTALLRCRGCGCTIFNAKYDAMATDEYTDQVDGRVRRKFIFEGGNPFCDCEDCIWLSDEDLPYRCDGWPVRERVTIELGSEGHNGLV